MAASIENATISPLLDTIDILNQTNGTAQKEVFVASTQGMLLSYSFLLISALLCVYFGSYRSITRKEEQKKSGEKPDVLTAKDGNTQIYLNIEKILFLHFSGYVSIYCQWIFIWNLPGYITCVKRIYNTCY
jgi:hypothetical protein